MASISRLVRKDEEGDFLALLCAAFQLSPGQSAMAFYSDPLFALRERWGLWERGELIAIASTLPMDFGRGRVLGISNVATRPDRRRLGYAGELLSTILDRPGPFCLFAHETGLYERLGFVHLDEVVSGALPTYGPGAPAQHLSDEQVRERYGEWASQDKCRLVRNDQRWGYWSWRKGAAYGLPSGGYVRFDGGVVRELLGGPSDFPLPWKGKATWSGLRLLATELGLPLENARCELKFMGLRLDWVPRLFLSDQF